MFDAIVCFFRSLFAERQREELLIRIPVDEPRRQFQRRR